MTGLFVLDWRRHLLGRHPELWPSLICGARRLADLVLHLVVDLRLKLWYASWQFRFTNKAGLYSESL